MAAQSSGVVSFKVELCCGTWGRVARSIILTPLPSPAAPLQLRRGEEDDWITWESLYRAARENSRRSAGQYQNRQLLLFTRRLPEATSNWPRKTNAGTQRRGRGKKHNQTTEWHSDILHRAQSNFNVLGCDGREALLQSRLSDPS